LASASGTWNRLDRFDMEHHQISFTDFVQQTPL